MLYSELLEKWVKGLCFHFNKHYLPLHQCADNQLRLIILGDDERMAEDGEIVAVEVDEGVEEIKYQPLKQCSFCESVGEEQGVEEIEYQLLK